MDSQLERAYDLALASYANQPSQPDFYEQRLQLGLTCPPYLDLSDSLGVSAPLASRAPSLEEMRKPVGSDSAFAGSVRRVVRSTALFAGLDRAFSERIGRGGVWQAAPTMPDGGGEPRGYTGLDENDTVRYLGRYAAEQAAWMAQGLGVGKVHVGSPWPPTQQGSRVLGLVPLRAPFESVGIEVKTRKAATEEVLLEFGWIADTKTTMHMAQSLDATPTPTATQPILPVTDLVARMALSDPASAIAQASAGRVGGATETDADVGSSSVPAPSPARPVVAASSFSSPSAGAASTPSPVLSPAAPAASASPSIPPNPVASRTPSSVPSPAPALVASAASHPRPKSSPSYAAPLGAAAPTAPFSSSRERRPSPKARDIQETAEVLQEYFQRDDVEVAAQTLRSRTPHSPRTSRSSSPSSSTLSLPSVPLHPSLSQPTAGSGSASEAPGATGSRAIPLRAWRNFGLAGPDGSPVHPNDEPAARRQVALLMQQLGVQAGALRKKAEERREKEKRRKAAQGGSGARGFTPEADARAEGGAAVEASVGATGGVSEQAADLNIIPFMVATDKLGLPLFLIGTDLCVGPLLDSLTDIRKWLAQLLLAVTRPRGFDLAAFDQAAQRIMHEQEVQRRSASPGANLTSPPPSMHASSSFAGPSDLPSGPQENDAPDVPKSTHSRGSSDEQQSATPDTSFGSCNALNEGLLALPGGLRVQLDDEMFILERREILRTNSAYEMAPLALQDGPPLLDVDLQGHFFAGGSARVFPLDDIAIKVVRLDVYTPDDLVQAVNDRFVLRFLNLHGLGPSSHAFYYSPCLCAHTMERVSGVSLGFWDIAQEWAEEILTAVRAIHAVGVIHGDLRPDNMILTPDDKIVLVDFGLAEIAPNRLAFKDELRDLLYELYPAKSDRELYAEVERLIPTM